MSQNKPLTARQDAFVRYYVANGFNATQAAASAGYAQDSCESKGSQLLRFVKVKDKISELMAKTAETAKKGAQDVYDMAASAAFLDIGDILDMDNDGVYLKDGVKFSDIPKTVRILIQALKERRTKFGVTVEIVFVDKLKALEMLARFNGMNKDKLEVTSDLTPAERSARIAELEAKRKTNGAE